MKIISARNNFYHPLTKKQNENTAFISKRNVHNGSSKSNTFCPSLKNSSFCGYPVHIFDGGAHAENMKHFAKAISPDMDIEIHQVDTNSKNFNTKQLDSLEHELRVFNESKSNFKDEYIAIPALANVPILNMQDQYNRVMGLNKKFTPENIKANKKTLLSFLEKIYKYPQFYKTYISYMDTIHQGIGHSFGVIQQINDLIQKGAKVYLPSGHPHDVTLKWLAGKKDLKPELYNYISTGFDRNHVIQNLLDEIKKKIWYDFNLLALSNANIIGVKNAKGDKDYLFAAYDSCITDGKRGVYNFTPLRDKNGKVLGFSYTDTTTNQYPIEEFPMDERIRELLTYVGKDSKEIVATEEETKAFLDVIQSDPSYIGLPPYNQKVYPVEYMFDRFSMRDDKIRLKGDYVDSQKHLFFRVNPEGKVFFPNCDCEGSGKPSVLSMWGSCFSAFNAIADNISLVKENKKVWQTPGTPYLLEYNQKMINMRTALEQKQYKQVEKYANDLIRILNIINTKNPSKIFVDNSPIKTKNLPTIDAEYEIYTNLINSLKFQGKIKDAENVTNELIDKLAVLANETSAKSLLECKRLVLEKNKNEQLWTKYKTEKEKWDASLLKQIFCARPTPPPKMDDISNEMQKIKIITRIANLYSMLANMCEQNIEFYPAKICKLASKDILDYTERGQKILTRRIEKIHYIGDLYNEVKPN